MTMRQIEWAAQHDWFRAWARSPDSPIVFIAVVYDSLSDSKVRFTDFSELRAWAGY